MKNLGSETFGTSEMKTDEVILMARVMKNNGDNSNSILEQIHFIDDCLSMLKMRSIINTRRVTPTGRFRKDGQLRDFINGRLDVLINNLKPTKNNE